jgi:hypothetical protein
MKKRRIIQFAVISLITVALSACSVSKEARGIKKNINGNWILQTITTEGITGVTKTTIFNEAEFSCFIGSEWNFISNNSMGSYTLIDQGKGCPKIKRYIRWSVYEPKDMEKEFQFKRLDDKKNSMDNGNGYRLKVTSTTNNMMSLRSDIMFNGNAGAIIYNFVKK